MPIITAYIGTSHFCLMLYKSSQDYSFFYSPYVYLPNIFLNNTSEQEFYISLIKIFCKNKKINFDSVIIYITGFLSTPNFTLDNVKKMDYSQIMFSFKDLYPVMVNDFALSTKFYIASKTKYQDYYQNDHLEALKLNKSIYKNIKAESIYEQISLDKEVLNNVYNSNIKWNFETPIIFMDSRFSYQILRPYDYVYMLSLINSPGIYDIYLDQSQSFILIKMLNIVLNKIEIPIDLLNIEHICTLINTTSDISCIVTSDGIEDYSISHLKDSIKSYSLDYQKDYEIIVTNNRLGTITKQIKGGSLGIVIDSREDRQKSLNDTLNFDMFVNFLDK